MNSNERRLRNMTRSTALAVISNAGAAHFFWPLTIVLTPLLIWMVYELVGIAQCVGAHTFVERGGRNWSNE